MSRKTKPARRLVSVECATAAGFRWLKRQMVEYPATMGELNADGPCWWRLPADETRFLEALRAAEGRILEEKSEVTP